MGINRDKPDLWKDDVAQSVDLYNTWFMEFAPKAFRETRIHTANQVEAALEITRYLSDISVEVLKSHPEVLPILRMSTCPPSHVTDWLGWQVLQKVLSPIWKMSRPLVFLQE